MARLLYTDVYKKVPKEHWREVRSPHAFLCMVSVSAYLARVLHDSRRLSDSRFQRCGYRSFVMWVHCLLSRVSHQVFRRRPTLLHGLYASEGQEAGVDVNPRFVERYNSVARFSKTHQCWVGRGDAANGFSGRMP